MAFQLFCPTCSTQLNPRDDLILAARRGGLRGLVLLHPEPGNYRMTASQGFRLVAGDTVEFSCPICQAALTSKLDDKLVQLDFVSTDGNRKGFVAFSRIFGDHATFVVSKDSLDSYGENAAAYARRGLFIGLRLG